VIVQNVLGVFAAAVVAVAPWPSVAQAKGCRVLCRPVVKACIATCIEKPKAPCRRECRKRIRKYCKDNAKQCPASPSGAFLR
jgi:hypothetical protein